MLRILILLVVSALLALADGPVLQTGQVKSYDGDGNIIAYGSIKDDGYYRAGAARSYSRNYNVVIDNATGLIWTDHESIKKPWVTQDNYDAGHYDDTSGDTAKTYCDFGLWRLPKIDELQTLVDYGQHYPSVTEGVFNLISSSVYWSSTSAVDYSYSAWHVNFSRGTTVFSLKSYDRYVRCVSGRSLAPSSLSRSGTIVTDSTTGLQWQDNWSASAGTGTWTEAINYCENTLELGGHNDWRLPNQNELLSIVDYSRSVIAIDISVFVNVRLDKYWSSTTYDSIPSEAWRVDFRSGYTSSNNKSDDSHYTRCVRGGQLGNAAIPSIIMYLLD